MNFGNISNVSLELSIKFDVNRDLAFRRFVI